MNFLQNRELVRGNKGNGLYGIRLHPDTLLWAMIQRPVWKFFASKRALYCGSEPGFLVKGSFDESVFSSCSVSRIIALTYFALVLTGHLEAQWSLPPQYMQRLFACRYLRTSGLSGPHFLGRLSTWHRSMGPEAVQVAVVGAGALGAPV